MDAYNYAIKLLAKRDYSSFELEKKLKRKSFDKETIKEIIKRLKQEKLLKDLEYLTGFIEKKLKRGPWGKKALYIFLKNKDTPEDMIESILAKIDDDFLISNTISYIKKKKKSFQKLEFFLRNRGFSEEIIRKIIEGIKKDELD